MARISVVMATYNGERFLREQLASFAAQSWLPDELIVSDDGSTDATLQIVRDFAASSAFPVRVHQNARRLGYADNFLSAAYRARSELIAFADQDDIWDPEKLACASAAFRTPSVVMSAHPVDLIDHNGAPLGHFAQAIGTSTICPALSLDPWGLYLGFTITFRRSLLELIPLDERGPDSHEPSKLAAHDRWIYTLANACGDTALIGRPLAQYRQHQRNQFGKQRARRLRRVMLPLSQITAMGEAYTAIAAHRAALFERASNTASEPELRARLRAAAALWQQLSGNSARRAAMYREPARLRRVALLANNLRAAVYRPPPSHRFVLQALLKDTIALIK